MSATDRTAAKWIPSTESERSAVLRQMNLILGSSHFRNSKRYTAILEYVVRETLAGHSDRLPEGKNSGRGGV